MLRSGELDTVQVVVLHGTVLLSLSLIDARRLQLWTEDDDAGLLGEDGADILVVVAVGIVEALGHRLLSIHLASGSLDGIGSGICRSLDLLASNHHAGSLQGLLLSS